MNVKTFVPIVVLALASTAPVVSFAQQSNAPLTRAQVYAQVVQIEKAGYDPRSAVIHHYPADIQAAEARVAARNGAKPAARTQPSGGAPE
jgi:hypothetical protein